MVGKYSQHIYQLALLEMHVQQQHHQKLWHQSCKQEIPVSN